MIKFIGNAFIWYAYGNAVKKIYRNRVNGGIEITAAIESEEKQSV